MAYPAPFGRRDERTKQTTAQQAQTQTSNPQVSAMLAQLLQQIGGGGAGGAQVTSASPLMGLMGGGGAGAGGAAGAAPAAGMGAGGGAAALVGLAGIMPGMMANEALVQGPAEGMQKLGRHLQGLPFQAGRRDYGQMGMNLGNMMAGFGGTVGGSKGPMTSMGAGGMPVGEHVMPKMDSEEPMPPQTPDTSANPMLAAALRGGVNPQPQMEGASNPLMGAINKGLGGMNEKPGLAQQLRGNQLSPIPAPGVTGGYRGGKKTPDPQSPLNIEMGEPTVVNNTMMPVEEDPYLARKRALSAGGKFPGAYPDPSGWGRR